MKWFNEEIWLKCVCVFRCLMRTAQCAASSMPVRRTSAAGWPTLDVPGTSRSRTWRCFRSAAASSTELWRSNTFFTNSYTAHHLYTEHTEIQNYKSTWKYVGFKIWIHFHVEINHKTRQLHKNIKKYCHKTAFVFIGILIFLFINLFHSRYNKIVVCVCVCVCG